MKWRNILELVFAIAISQSAGLIGSLFTFTSVDSWYSMLERPALSPPNWVFGPVWTTLYTLMGISAYLAWRAAKKKQRAEIAGVFLFQLALNAIWSIIFFGLQDPEFAFVEIALLWVVIIWNIVVFWKVSKVSAVLLIPYLLWVSFASYLTLSIAILN